ncbi:MAG: circularly permuted type 2 ATP-grasp protein, partial [Gemmataceae bacterium]
MSADTDPFAYAPPAGGFDEAFAPGGLARPHWHGLLRSLRGFGLPALKHRWAEARHLIRQNGVTYNVYGDPRGMARPWQLDPVPLVLSTAEADALEAGLTQRGRLLEALLRDLYGPQHTLTHGLLPPELVFENAAFLRPCHGSKPPGDRYLHLYAANVGRDPDGYFWVLGDRTQCPSGAGYALENRIVLSRMLPDVFRECQVQRLALFFRTLRDTLAAIAPHGRDNPRIVLLTPGPYNETYFEHAYLARYLGYPLVEGGDLTVRDNRVFLKVLGGLQPVDVIFRRLDDDFCDPLELRHDSFLGVPGLVQAARSGTVAVANALGSGLLETPALLAFLPGLCRHLLGEELRLPSAPTWWCGQPREMEHVLANLDDMVIKPARPSLRLEPTFAGELTRPRRDALAARIRAAPRDFIGQQRV